MSMNFLLKFLTNFCQTLGAAAASALLPGKTYSDMSHLHQAENLLASPPDHLFTPHKHLANHPRHGQTLTVHAGKVKTTFGINDLVQTGLVATQETKASKQTSIISLAPQRQWTQRCPYSKRYLSPVNLKKDVN